MAERRDGLFIWITWLSKVMAGEQNCVWASWFKTHYTNYEKAPSDFDLVKWTMDHTRLVHELHAERRTAGDQVYLERENEIRYQVRENLVVVGKPDLVAISNKGATIYDVKTGKERRADQVQVLLYMYLLPLTVARYAGTKPSGCVVYGSTRANIPPEAADSGFARNFNHFLDAIAGDIPAVRVPSRNECRFCDIAKSECPDRMES